jgi:hypothetical protein
MLLRLGSVATVVVSGAAAAREVMKEHDVDCCSRPRVAGAQAPLLRPQGRGLRARRRWR